MKSYKNLTIIGTSHISIESVKQVESILLKIKPDIIALELDPIRFQALLKPEKKIKLQDIRKIGLKGFLFNIIGAYIQKKLGEIVKVKPGSEMKKAIKTAKKLNSKIYLIDQDIRTTLKKLSKEFTWKEKFQVIEDIFLSFFSSKKISFDLTKVPSQKLIDQLTSELKEKYPSLYKVLVKERNEIMAKNLYKLIQTNKNIVAILGIGHEKEIINIIKKNDAKVLKN